MAVASALMRAGMRVYVPFFAADSRVDLVAERDDGLLRVQSKTARFLGGSVFFRTCSNTANRPVDYRGEVDAFGVYSPDLDRVFLVPVEDVPLRAAYLRVDPPRNGQTAGIRWAADYAVGPP